MDKLKYIKLENEDGSYSSSIPLAVDSDYVDVNGKSLTNVLADKASTAGLATVATDLNAQKSRIDNLAALDEGSTTGDAELIDIRTGYNGIQYTNAGSAVREQVSTLYSVLSSTVIKEASTLEWVNKTLDANGEPKSDSTSRRSLVFQILKQDIVSTNITSTNNNIQYTLYAWDLENNPLGFWNYNNTFSTASVEFSTNITLQNINNWNNVSKIRLYAKKVDTSSSGISEQDITNSLHFLINTLDTNRLDIIEDNISELQDDVEVLEDKMAKEASTLEWINKSLDANGEPFSDNVGRRSLVSQILKQDIISTTIASSKSNIQYTLYAWDSGNNPLGFWNDNNTLSTESVTYSSQIILGNINNWNNVSKIRLCAKKTDASSLSPISEQDITNSLHFLINAFDSGRLDIIEDNINELETDVNALETTVDELEPYYKNTIWCAIGDSITYGTYSTNNGSIARDPSISYPAIVSHHLGYTLYNYGLPNLGFAIDATDSSITGDLSVDDVLNNHNYSDANLITVSLGTNDWGRNSELGSMTDGVNVVSVYGRIKKIITTLKTLNPKARIVFLTPIPRYTTGNLDTKWCLYSTNNKGYTLNQVKEAIINVCMAYGIEYINLTDTNFFNYTNHEYYLKDNLHPTIEGHAYMGRWLANKII